MSISYRWIKLYIEILDDPKMGLLPNHLWRRTIEFFLMAGECGKGGALGSVPEIAWRLRVSEVDLLQSLRSLEEIGIVHCTQENVWVVSKFADRQAAEPGKERTEAYRKREYQRASNEPVTTRHIDKNRIDKNRIDKNRIEEEEQQKPPQQAEGEIFRLYESEIGPITPRIADLLRDASAEYPSEWFAPAIAEAVRNNVRRWAYVEAILKRWQVDGFQTRKSSKTMTNDDQSKSYIVPEHEDEPEDAVMRPPVPEVWSRLLGIMQPMMARPMYERIAVLQASLSEGCLTLWAGSEEDIEYVMSRADTTIRRALTGLDAGMEVAYAVQA